MKLPLCTTGGSHFKTNVCRTATESLHTSQKLGVRGIKKIKPDLHLAAQTYSVQYFLSDYWVCHKKGTEFMTGV